MVLAGKQISTSLLLSKSSLLFSIAQNENKILNKCRLLTATNGSLKMLEMSTVFTFCFLLSTFREQTY